ncbi:MAG: hypothetical protein LUC32_02710 [Clostridiales bacterium]|nr:hypothetical protein [Clostridiales bacterium]
MGGYYQMKIAITGVSGSMGREALKQTMELDEVRFIRVLVTPKKSTINIAINLKRHMVTE